MTEGLHEPFQDTRSQREAAEFGMWVFLASEVIFFGGLFTGYALYRYLWPEGFVAGVGETNLTYGTINTALLLASSATMSVAVWTGRARLKRQAMAALGLTAALGLAFMVVKALEYAEDVKKALIPGWPDFPLSEPGAQLFYSFYWVMTGAHAVHLSIGIGAVLITLWRVGRERTGWRENALLHTLSLYWHLVDMVWIFLFPLFYLAGRG